MAHLLVPVLHCAHLDKSSRRGNVLTVILHLVGEQRRYLHKIYIRAIQGFEITQDTKLEIMKTRINDVYSFNSQLKISCRE